VLLDRLIRQDLGREELLEALRSEKAEGAAGAESGSKSDRKGADLPFPATARVLARAYVRDYASPEDIHRRLEDRVVGGRRLHVPSLSAEDVGALCSVRPLERSLKPYLQDARHREDVASSEWTSAREEFEGQEPAGIRALIANVEGLFADLPLTDGKGIPFSAAERQALGEAALRLGVRVTALGSA
jgi:hypothetical protein